MGVAVAEEEEEAVGEVAEEDEGVDVGATARVPESPRPLRKM